MMRRNVQHNAQMGTNSARRPWGKIQDGRNVCSIHYQNQGVATPEATIQWCKQHHYYEERHGAKERNACQPQKMRESVPETNNATLAYGGHAPFTPKSTCLGSSPGFLLDDTEDAKNRINEASKAMGTLKFM